MKRAEWHQLIIRKIESDIDTTSMDPFSEQVFCDETTAKRLSDMLDKFVEMARSIKRSPKFYEEEFNDWPDDARRAIEDLAAEGAEAIEAYDKGEV